MRIAIVGSRRYPSAAEVRAFVAELPSGTVVVSGGARGVDTWAAEAALERGLTVELFCPDYKAHGERAPLVRNQLIVDAVERLVAFWDGESTGTQHVVGLARKAGKPVEVRQPKSRGSR